MVDVNHMRHMDDQKESEVEGGKCRGRLIKAMERR